MFQFTPQCSVQIDPFGAVLYNTPSYRVRRSLAPFSLISVCEVLSPSVQVLPLHHLTVAVRDNRSTICLLRSTLNDPSAHWDASPEKQTTAPATASAESAAVFDASKVWCSKHCHMPTTDNCPSLQANCLHHIYLRRWPTEWQVTASLTKSSCFLQVSFKCLLLLVLFLHHSELSSFKVAFYIHWSLVFSWNYPDLRFLTIVQHKMSFSRIYKVQNIVIQLICMHPWWWWERTCCNCNLCS